MKDCIFCKIVKGEIETVKIWEDEEFLAILDKNPNMKGMTLVITKKHYDSYAFALPDDVYQRLMLASKKVALLLDKRLKVKRTAMVMEGLAVNHVHIKLYPLHGIDEKFKEMLSKERIYFEKYEGYISTQLGPEADMEALRKTGKIIKSEK